MQVLLTSRAINHKRQRLAPAQMAAWLKILEANSTRTAEGFLIESAELYTSLVRGEVEAPAIASATVVQVAAAATQTATAMPAMPVQIRSIVRSLTAEERAEMEAAKARAAERLKVCQECGEFLGAEGKTTVRCYMKGGGTGCTVCNLLNGQCLKSKW